jgi:hypothetical protein
MLLRTAMSQESTRGEKRGNPMCESRPTQACVLLFKSGDPDNDRVTRKCALDAGSTLFQDSMDGDWMMQTLSSKYEVVVSPGQIALKVSADSRGHALNKNPVGSAGSNARVEVVTVDTITALKKGMGPKVRLV